MAWRKFSERIDSTVPSVSLHCRLRVVFLDVVSSQVVYPGPWLSFYLDNMGVHKGLLVNRIQLGFQITKSFLFVREYLCLLLEGPCLSYRPLEPYTSMIELCESFSVGCVLFYIFFFLYPNPISTSFLFPRVYRWRECSTHITCLSI